MKLINLFYWLFIDIYRYWYKIFHKIEIKPHLYGIEGYFGLPGKGKTMGLVFELDCLRKRYKDKIYIITNFGYKDQDFIFSSYKQLFERYDKPLIVAWDEVQNEFNSRDFKNFPIELLTLLTQNRKGHGVKILYTAQRFDRVDKVFRELTVMAYDCNTLLGRYTRLRGYHWEDYIMKNSQTDVNLKMRIKPLKRISFIQTDLLRDKYDSFKMLESAMNKDYLDREELSNLSRYSNG